MVLAESRRPWLDYHLCAILQTCSVGEIPEFVSSKSGRFVSVALCRYIPALVVEQLSASRSTDDRIETRSEGKVPKDTRRERIPGSYTRFT